MKQKRHQAGAVVAIEPAPGSHSDHRSDDRTAPEGLVEHWADKAVTQATVQTLNDPAGHLATVAGIDGPWGFGQSEDEALDDLRSVLVDWASLKLEDGDDDIPIMEGVRLVTAP